MLECNFKPLSTVWERKLGTWKMKMTSWRSQVVTSQVQPTFMALHMLGTHLLHCFANVDVWALGVVWRYRFWFRRSGSGTILHLTSTTWRWYHWSQGPHFEQQGWVFLLLLSTSYNLCPLYSNVESLSWFPLCIINENEPPNWFKA